jgi:hypothetical protein
VPYRGAAPAINDLLGQQVQMTFLDLPVILPHIKAGSLKPIALGARARADRARRADHGGSRHARSLIENWYGMIAPGGTPGENHRRAEPHHQRGDGRSGVKAKLADQGLTVAGDTPEHFRGFIDSETRKWAKVIKDAGLAQPEEPFDVRATKEAVKRALLHLENVFLDRLDHRQVSVNDKVEDGVQDIIRTMAQQAGGRFELGAEFAMRPSRAMPNRNDKILPDKDGCFAIGDVILLKMSRARHDKQLIAVDVNFRQLVCLERILDRERMKPVVLLELLELSFGRLE